MYQLQKRVRTLREQLQRRDLHLDLLRKKINLQEENSRVRSLLEAEKEEANLRYLTIRDTMNFNRLGMDINYFIFLFFQS